MTETTDSTENPDAAPDHEVRVLHRVSLRELRVARVDDVNAVLRRVVLVGDELGSFVRDGIDCEPFVTAAFDDHVKIFLPRDGELVLPAQDDGHLDWPSDPPPLPRDYTVRSWNEAAGELTIDLLVDHGGPGAAWAESVQVGDSVHVAGPRSSHLPPPDVGAAVLVADLSAVPAVDRYLDEVADPSVVTVVVVAREEQVVHLLDRGAEVVVLDPDDELLEAIDRRIVAAVASPGPVWVWAACEFGLARGIRRVLKDHDIDRRRMAVTHYWKRGDDAVAAHDASLDDPVPSD